MNELDLTWREIAVALGGLWLMGMSWYLGRLADKASVKVLSDALNKHMSDDSLRFEQVRDDILASATEAKQDRYHLRSELAAKFDAQQVINMRIVQQIGELSGAKNVAQELIRLLDDSRNATRQQ